MEKKKIELGARKDEGRYKGGRRIIPSGIIQKTDEYFVV
jgi:hypothetical protein